MRKAIAESDVKEEDGDTLVNLNITTGANEKLEELKKILDKETGRSLFPCTSARYSSYISVEAEVLDKCYMQLTDHKMIAITLKES